MSIPGLSAWLASDQGRYVIDWEMSRIDGVVSDIFGFNAIQCGMPQIDYLRANRIPLRLRVGEDDSVDVRCDLRFLPFMSASIDLVVLPHILEFHTDPHQILREVERVLMPEGQVVIIGFNPFSLWGLRRRLPMCPEAFPWTGRYLSVPRIKDWLALLSFEPDRGHFGCYVPPWQQEKWLRRFHAMELAGDRWWPIAGGLYMIRAIKRVHGMRLIKPSWRRVPQAPKALSPVVQKEQAAMADEKNTETVIDIYTDGACRGNPGPGGWGALLRGGGGEKELCGGERDTTNNRMELTAVIRALEALKRPVSARVHTDSQYVQKGISQWINGWRRNGWRTSDRKPVKNADLWQQLDLLAKSHHIEWLWVRGHAGHPENERADALANRGIDELGKA